MKRADELFKIRLTKYGYERDNKDDHLIPDPEPESVALVREFIKLNCKKHSRINKKCNSYIMKHIAERAVGRYIGNGEFIKAAYDEGYSITQYVNELTCDINMKCKTSAYSNYYFLTDYQLKKEYI